MLLKLMSIVCIIQLTSANYKYDGVTQTPENDGVSSGVSSHDVILQLLGAVSQLQNAVSQLKACQSELQKAVCQLKTGQSELKTGVAEGQKEVLADLSSLDKHQKELQTGQSELQDAVSQLKSGLGEQHEEVLAGLSQLQTDVAEMKDEIEQKKNLTADCTPVLIQQNVDGSNFFNRSWAELKVGFGDKNGNYWLGNDQLSQLTMSGRYQLRFDLVALNGTEYWAEYSRFIVKNEAQNYQLEVSGYWGNAGYDALGYVNGMMFTTYDRDNDQWRGRNCAVDNRGGFWYKQCAYCSVNAVSGSYDDFDWYNIKLQSTRMYLKCL